MKIGLVIIFNHAFEANLPRLDALYAGRFSSVRYLMPFYQGTRADVFPAFHSSYTFQGFVAEASAGLAAEGCDHYLFIGDDLLLRGDLNEATLPGVLGLDPETAYIKELLPLAQTGVQWTHALRALCALKKNRFVEFDGLLPDRLTADARLEKLGLATSQIPIHQLGARLFYSWRRDRWSVFQENLLHAVVHRRRGPARLPLLAAYSDLFAVPAGALARFCHLCGVFAAMGLFAEVAIPTALALSCRCVHTEKDTAHRGREIWDADECDTLLNGCGQSLQRLLSEMPSNQLYIHPVKFSRLRF